MHNYFIRRAGKKFKLYCGTAKSHSVARVFSTKEEAIEFTKKWELKIRETKPRIKK